MQNLGVNMIKCGIISSFLCVSYSAKSNFSCSVSPCGIPERMKNMAIRTGHKTNRFTLHNFCLKLSHATSSQLELYCVLCKSSTHLTCDNVGELCVCYTQCNSSYKQVACDSFRQKLSPWLNMCRSIIQSTEIIED
jgi:hypothetical protein